MAGAMRKMGIYLGLVEDDESGYGSYGDGEYADGYYSDEDYADSDRPGDRSDRDRGDRVPDRARSVPDYADESAPRRESGTVRSGGFATATATATRPTTTLAASGGSALSPSIAGSDPATGYDRSGMRRITTLHPRTYNEARTIGEHFREGVPVIMNLTEMDDSDAKRLVDFAAGLSFGLRGSIERVTNKVFLISPQNVSVTAEDKARIAEGGFFNQS